MASNKQIVVAPLAADTERTVRDTCASQGCTCGDRLVVEVTVLTPKQAVERRLIPGQKHTDVAISHVPTCPMLLRMALG